MERKNRIPNTRLNRFYDDTDFDLEIGLEKNNCYGKNCIRI